MIYIKEDGVFNGIAAVLITVRERVIAFITKFPLHLELYSRLDDIKHRDDEVPIVLKDIGGTLRDYYSDAGRSITDLDAYDES